MKRRIPIPVLPDPVRWLAVLAVAGVILYFSVLALPPAEPVTPTSSAVVGDPSSGDTSGGSLSIAISLEQFRHFAGYFVFGLTLAYAIITNRRPLPHKALVVIAAVILFGGSIEFLQSFVPRRSFSLTDFLVNTVAGMASLGWFLLERFTHPITVPELINRQS